MTRLPLGKLPAPLLNKLLSKVTISDPQVVVGPSLGEDNAVISIGDRLLVAKTDPITFASDLIGWYAVQINANDIATSGVMPRWFMATVLLPQGAESKLAEDIFKQINCACRSMNITLVGGHTEITHDLNRPLVVGCMLAEAGKNEIITTGDAQYGDDIVLTKGIAIEGSAVLARERRKKLISAGVSRNTVKQAEAYLQKPGISVLEEAMVAVKSAEIHSMHDPTEGGLATALREMALASHNGLMVEKDKIPVLSECAEICQKLEIDPLGLLASGALLLTLSPGETLRLLDELRNAGISASIIGQMTKPEQGIKIKAGEEINILPEFERDELARYLENN